LVILIFITEGDKQEFEPLNGFVYHETKAEVMTVKKTKVNVDFWAINRFNQNKRRNKFILSFIENAAKYDKPS